MNTHYTWTRLRDHLIATGAMTPAGTTRRAQPRLCRTCNAHVITGLDSNLAALAITADPTPLDQLGELTALTQGRRTVTLEPDGPRRLVLNYRDAGRIRHRPPGGLRYDVLPEHACGRPLSAVEATTGALGVALPPAGSPAPY
jgi:hypothetical protein